MNRIIVVRIKVSSAQSLANDLSTGDRNAIIPTKKANTLKSEKHCMFDFK